MDIYSSKKKARHAKRRHSKPMNKKQKRIMIVMISVASALALLLCAVIGAFIWLSSGLNHNSDPDKDPELNSVKPISEEITNIALFGIDSRSNNSFKGLSDSIMILSLNNETGAIKIISIMRDSLVEIPKSTNNTVYNKINSAYSLGGPVLAIKTLNKNFGLDIKEYATVNFSGMSDIVDAVGGIEIEVQEKELDYADGMNASIREQAYVLGIKNPPYVKKAGLQKLSGIQAVAWARIRHYSTTEGQANDYGRTDRQRVVMEKLLNKALDMNVSQYPGFIKKVLPFIETSLSFDEILKLSGILSKDVNFTQTRVPQSEYVMTAPKISGVGSSVYYNLEFASDIIYEYIYNDILQEDYLKTHDIVKKGWYKGPTVSNTSTVVSTTSETSSTVSKVETPVSSDVSSTESFESSDIVVSEPGSKEESSTESLTSTESKDVVSEDKKPVEEENSKPKETSSADEGSEKEE